MRSFLGAELDGDLRAGAHGAASDQLQVDQHRAGGGQLRGRQVDLDVREKVRAVGVIGMGQVSINRHFSVLPAILLHGTLNWSAIALPVMPVGGETRLCTIAVTLLIVTAVIAILKPGPHVARRGYPR
ncbi:hypothetical protein [Cypionkella psychrotolerans]|uniref:hypothetical protein n=1 Tax=Cypionkella psychrotolerans TaxID=1678131 RepID=UPI000A5AA9CA|nr:hypothetical protein [Cypionkella psychrotolerans]